MRFIPQTQLLREPQLEGKAFQMGLLLYNVLSCKVNTTYIPTNIRANTGASVTGGFTNSYTHQEGTQ